MSAAQAFWKHWRGGGEIACNEQFLLFPQYFYPFEELSFVNIKFEIVVCKLFQFGRAKNFSLLKGLTVHNSLYEAR